MNWHDWLPIPQQMSDAAQLRPGAYTRTTMQQALGMIVVLGLLAGLLPFVVNWIGATRMNAALPLAEAARAGIRMDASLPDFFVGAPGVNPSAIAELYATLAGLPQPLPGWLAGGLSSLGVWLSLPINWLGGWIVYGALVMAVNVALGATCTLQRFYAATGYAVVPLLLTAFAPVACLGPLASLIGVLWAIAVYVRANQDVTGLPLLHSGLAVALPALILLFGAFLVAVLLLGSFVLAVI
ncbi:MAG: hypothetical protein KDD84_13050 [Caldilineaceae bacterium]|nr:hypothetical protein [Caldilineaceae bacterium]